MFPTWRAPIWSSAASTPRAPNFARSAGHLARGARRDSGPTRRAPSTAPRRCPPAATLAGSSTGFQWRVSDDVGWCCKKLPLEMAEKKWICKGFMLLWVVRRHLLTNGTPSANWTRIGNFTSGQSAGWGESLQKMAICFCRHFWANRNVYSRLNQYKISWLYYQPRNVGHLWNRAGEL